MFVEDVHGSSAHFFGVDGYTGEAGVDLFGDAGIIEGNQLDVLGDTDAGFLQGLECSDSQAIAGCKVSFWEFFLCGQFVFD